MGTSKHVAILLTVALAGILTAGQDQPPTPSQAAPRGPSNTRSASCLVRITVDPAILPLSPETVSRLIHSPAVLGKALREALSVNTLEDLLRPEPQGGVVREPIMIRWLNTPAAQMPPGARSPRQGPATGLEEIYGRDYMQQMMGSASEEKKGEANGSPQTDSSSGSVREDRSNAPGTGVIGVASRTARAQGQATEMSRQPGESDAAYRIRLAQMRAQQQALQEMKGRSMGSMGGGMGGYGMGGMGMGGAGGGMMRGYGGMGGIGFDPALAAVPQGMGQSATIELQVNLPDTIPPMADEFLKGVVRNLQDSLSRAHKSYEEELADALKEARVSYLRVQSDLDDMQSDLEGRFGAVSAVRRQLETEVDLSQLQSATPLATAIEILRKSVEPPLNIVVLWRDVQTNANTEPTSPINIEGSPKIRLATALDLLVKGMHAGVDTTTPMWKIKDDAIVIGTTAILRRSQEAAGQPQVETDARNLAGQRSELVRRIQSLELDLAGMQARREAIGAQINVVREQVAKRLSEDPVMQELEKLVQVYLRATRTPDGRIVTPDSAEGQESMIRARIQVANRREELSKQAGGSQLEEYTKELSRMAIDRTEKEAQLQVVRKQLDEVQRQLAQALTFDPEAARLRLTQESLDIAARRVAELQTRLSNLQLPMVTVIGAN